MEQTPFVERFYDLANAALRVWFDTPYLAPGGEYRCRWNINWPEKLRSSEAAGIDGVQALMLAMRTVHSELIESDYCKSGKLKYLEQADLDLPPHWGNGPLYEAGPDPRGQ